MDNEGIRTNMHQGWTQRRIYIYLAIAVCAQIALGCAGLRVPRIDPTGERVFVWPSTQPAVVTPVLGNVEAPPVFTDPYFPMPATSALGVPSVAATLPSIPQDTLTITPARMLAPVGSEVILKAGLCTRENYLLTKTQVDWLIARESAGQFVSLGGRGWLQDPLLPWNRAKKVDNQFATGYTAKVPLTLTRGTVDVSDDVQIEPGEAWASITSPVEGVSHITAVAPEIEAWTNRRATATIYWVDLQWTFPPASVAAGGSQVLTTTVSRQTDGAPWQGWLVRYEVAGGGGAFSGGLAEQAVEVPTDARGQASIDVTPTGDTGNTTQISIQIMRPEGFGGINSPKMIVAEGSTTINWTGQSAPYLPPAGELSGGEPFAPPQTPASQPPVTPPVQPVIPPAQRPVLEIDVEGDDQALVGGDIRFRVVVRNTGSGAATGLILVDQFDDGFLHPRDDLGSQEIQKPLSQDLAPGDSIEEFIRFDVVRAGSICHTVKVSCSEGVEASSKRICVQAVDPPPQKQARIDVEKRGDRLRSVGENTLFTLSITNSGEVPLTNLEIVDEYDAALQATPADPEFKRLPGGNNRISFFRRIPRLDVGQVARFDTECQCIAPTNSACSKVIVTAETDTNEGAIQSAAEHCLEITPPATDEAGGVFPEAIAGGNSLQVGITPFADTVRVGGVARFQIIIDNKSTTTYDQVQLRVQLPVELAPDVNRIETNADVRANFIGSVLRFDPIAQVRPGDRFSFVIPVTGIEVGVREIVAELFSNDVSTDVRTRQQVEIAR